MSVTEDSDVQIVKWLGGGLLAVIAYVVISNTFWLLFGSRLLQSLPGVKIKGLRGTVKIAAMLMLTAGALAFWVLKRPPVWLGVRAVDRPLTAEISAWVAYGARWLESVRRPKRGGGPV